MAEEQGKAMDGTSEAKPEAEQAAPKKKTQGRKAGSKPPEPKIIEVPPVVGPAKMRQRHWVGILSFVGMVIFPLVLLGWYLAAVSINQYASVVGFTVRQNQGASATDILGGFSQLVGGGGGSSDTDILHKFIQSPALVQALDEKLDLASHYSQYASADPVFSLKENADPEDLINYWSRVGRVSYDQSSGLIELQILAFDPQTAQQIARAILDESRMLINNLNAQARQDIIQYAEADLELAKSRLKVAQEELTLFRNRTQIVDPSIDLQGRLGVLNNLQQQLADALVEQDVLADGSNASDPRLDNMRLRIEVIRKRIKQERKNVASDSETVDGVDYPALIAEYENLLVNREFAQSSYSAALASLESARADASRQSRYLAIYVEPTLASSAEYPRRWVIFGVAGLFVFLIWATLVLVYYSIRDSR